jgi:membrane-bound lytic murein transglycosylase B
MTAGRLIASFATALLIVAGLGYVGSQTVLARPDLPPSRSSAYVAAPRPETRMARQPGAPAAPTRVDPRWVATTAAAASIPAPAVRAYATAQLAEPDGCDVGWTTLAGIGWVESHHGTIGGRTLGGDGRSSRPVLGPALNGEGGFAAIPSTPETSSWHGDAVWDHAVGPLQFIPSTWETWGADGDGDGSADPNDLDDAALAAVDYLCADGHDLTSATGWTDAVFSYNHAQSYVDAVYAAATQYAELVN